MHLKVLLLFLLGVITEVLSSPLNAVSMTIGPSVATTATSFASSFASSFATSFATSTATGPVVSEDCKQYFAPSDHGSCFGRNCGPQNFNAGETPTHCVVEGITHDKRRDLCTWVDNFLHCPKHTKMVTRTRVNKGETVSTSTSSIVTHTGNHGKVFDELVPDCRLVGGDIRCGEQLSGYLAKHAGKKTHSFDTTTTVTPTVVPTSCSTAEIHTVAVEKVVSKVLPHCRLVDGSMRCGEQHTGKKVHSFDTTTTVTPTIVPTPATALVNGTDDLDKRHILCGRVHGKVLCGSAFEAAHRKHVSEEVRVAAAQNSLIDVIRNANDYYTTTTVMVTPAATLSGESTVHETGKLEPRWDNCGTHHGRLLCGEKWYNLKHEWRLESLSIARFNATHLKKTMTETPFINAASDTAVMDDFTTTITVAPTPEATHIPVNLEKRRNLCRVHHGKLLCGEQLADALGVGHHHVKHNETATCTTHHKNCTCTKHHKTSAVSAVGDMDTTTTVTQSIAVTTNEPELGKRTDSLFFDHQEWNKLTDAVQNAEHHVKHNGIAKVTGSKQHNTTCTKHHKTPCTKHHKTYIATDDGDVESTVTVFQFVAATGVPQELEKRRDWCRMIDGEVLCGKRLVKVLAHMLDPTRHNMTGKAHCTKHHGNQTSVHTHEAAAISTSAVKSHHDDKFPHHCRIVAGKVHCEKHVVPTPTDYFYTTTTTTVSAHAAHVKTAVAAMEHVEKEIVEYLLAHRHQGRSIISVASDVAGGVFADDDDDDDTVTEADFDAASASASKIEPRQFPHALPGGVPQPGFDFLQLKRDAYVRGHEKHGNNETSAEGAIPPPAAKVLEETPDNSMASITGSNTMVGNEDIAGPETPFTGP